MKKRTRHPQSSEDRLREIQKILDRDFPKAVAEQEKDYTGWLKRSGMWMPTPKHIQKYIMRRKKDAS